MKQLGDGYDPGRIEMGPTKTPVITPVPFTCRALLQLVRDWIVFRCPGANSDTLVESHLLNPTKPDGTPFKGNGVVKAVRTYLESELKYELPDKRETAGPIHKLLALAFAHPDSLARFRIQELGSSSARVRKAIDWLVEQIVASLGQPRLRVQLENDILQIQSEDVSKDGVLYDALVCFGFVPRATTEMRQFSEALRKECFNEFDQLGRSGVWICKATCVSRITDLLDDSLSFAQKDYPSTAGTLIIAVHSVPHVPNLKLSPLSEDVTADEYESIYWGHDVIYELAKHTFNEYVDHVPYEPEDGPLTLITQDLETIVHNSFSSEPVGELRSYEREQIPAVVLRLWTRTHGKR